MSTCIRYFPSPSLDRVTGYPDRGFRAPFKILTSCSVILSVSVHKQSKIPQTRRATRHACLASQENKRLKTERRCRVGRNRAPYLGGQDSNLSP
jgi:hypothetical protein